MTWAIHVLGLAPVTGLDDRSDSLEGYGSPMHGRRPIVRRFPDRDAELDALATQVRTWLDDGVEPHAIAVAARGDELANQVKRRLKAAGTTAVSPAATGDGVRVGSMHAVKGLEFRCVAVIGVDESLVPLDSNVTPLEIDRAAHEDDLQIERCLLFVGCTRPRDRLSVSYAGSPSRLLPR